MSSIKDLTSKGHLLTILQLLGRVIALSYLWIPVYILRRVVIKVVSCTKLSFGRILSHRDSGLVEDYTESPPKNTIAFTLVLNGDVELNKLQQLFTANVLTAKRGGRGDKLRYPELQQYQVDYAGFMFWRNDSSFHIGNHIIEKTYNKKLHSISQLHNVLLNLMYSRKRSPWGIVLIRNYENKGNKTLLAYRSHHSLGDTKSLLKILVECLGEKKQLKLPNVVHLKESTFGKLKYYALLPLYFMYIKVLCHYFSQAYQNSPWFFKNDDAKTRLNVSISRKMSIARIKSIARKNNVTTSAVILSIISGAVGKCDQRIKKQKGILCEYVFPKPNHPDTLANHNVLGYLTLPTDVESPIKRAKKCNRSFLHLRYSNIPKYDECIRYQNGTWFNPLRAKFQRNNMFPLIVTNIATDTEGFDVGNCHCSELVMTCGPLQGACGVIICAVSYKNSITLSVTSKEGILDESEVKTLVNLMEKEFNLLRSMST